MPYFQLPAEAGLYTAEQTRQLDRLAIESGIAGFELMQRAGRTAYRALRHRWPAARRLAVLCGAGNNGGDGFIIAGLAHEQQLAVTVYLVGGQGAVDRLRGEALEAYYWARTKGVVFTPFEPGLSLDADLVVDALLGTGLKDEVRGEYVQAIEAINGSQAPVLAVDVPSGLCADSGAVLGSAVRADLCVTFIGAKRGLFTHQGPEVAAEVMFDDLQLPDSVYGRVPAGLALADEALLRRTLRPRARTAHKGHFGHVLVVGGDRGMGGAVAMAARAAARSGAGLVSVATRSDHLALVNSHCPEVMVHGVRSGQELQGLLKKASVVLIGCGLGRSAWSQQLLHAVQAEDKPLVLDADALNMLHTGELVTPRHRDSWVLTPHPGEAARLLGVDTAAIQGDRFAAVNRLQETFGGVTVLKGAGTLIAGDGGRRLCRAGNPGMASGGMGDVLGGMIAGLLAQGLTPFQAACCGVLVHGKAADEEVALYGERGLLATDLIERSRRLLNPEHHLQYQSQQEP